MKFKDFKGETEKEGNSKKTIQKEAIFLNLVNWPGPDPRAVWGGKMVTSSGFEKGKRGGIGKCG